MGEIDALLERLPTGWGRVRYRSRPWSVTRLDAVGGRAVSVYAEELGGSGRVSANVYLLPSGHRVLKPCEMPAEEVLDFLRSWHPDSGSAGKIDSAPGGGSPGSQHDAASSGHAP